MRQKVADAFLRPLKTALADLQDLLQAHPVTLADVPNDIAELWRTADGRARVEVLPKGDPNDNDTLRHVRARGAHRRSPTRPAGRSRFWNPATPSCGRSSRRAPGR